MNNVWEFVSEHPWATVAALWISSTFILDIFDRIGPRRKKGD